MKLIDRAPIPEKAPPKSRAKRTTLWPTPKRTTTTHSQPCGRPSRTSPCNMCLWYRALEGAPWGQCHALPPKVAALKSQRWPLVWGNEGCGRWEDSEVCA